MGTIQNDGGHDLCQTLDKLGASEYLREKYQSLSMQSEHCATLLSGYIFSEYIFGSASEGTKLLSFKGDVDVVMCYNFCRVITGLDEWEAGSFKYFLMVQDVSTRPGYVKLQHVRDDGVPLNIHNSSNSTIKHDHHGRLCIDHLTAYNQYCHHKSSFTDRHGPAFTTDSPTCQEPTDIVPAFRCLSVPPSVSAWLTCYKDCFWPSQSYVDKLEQFGCFVVPVGHPSSTEQDIEWRISFSLQERDIMFSLSPVQHKCYIFLKMIKLNAIKPNVGDAISSYHMKTCLLALKTRTSDKFWCEENFIVCVRLCLLVLLSWANKSFCPNFFIPSENMFDRRNLTIEKLNIVRWILHTLIYRHTLSFTDVQKLANNNCDYLMDMLYLGNKQLRLSVCDRDIFVLKMRIIWDKELRKRSIFRCILHNVSSIDGFIGELVDMFVDIFTLTDHRQDAVDKARKMRDSLLTSMILQAKSSSTALLSDNELVNACNGHKNGHHTNDVMTSELVLASAMFKRKLFTEMSGVLEHVQECDKTNILTLCKCNNIPQSFDSIFLKMPEQFDLESDFQTHIAPCVIFSNIDVKILVEPMHLELVRKVGTSKYTINHLYDYWFDWSVVDARVYLYFMRYRLFRETFQVAKKRTAFRKLRLVIKNAVKFSWDVMERLPKTSPSADHREVMYALGHLETAWNLLGWIYVQEGMQDAAARCFTRSWAKRRHHNAAKWHIAQLLFDSLSDEQCIESV